jgi:hypothetical protein
MKYKPAVTRVEEWTRAEIGVGAAIARGSQGEKGYSALLVINVRISIEITRRGAKSDVKKVKSGRK